MNTFQTLIEQVNAEFQVRQSAWKQFDGYDIQSLEMLVRAGALGAQAQERLVEYLRARVQIVRLEAERQEKFAEYWQRASLTLAVTLFAVASWFLTELGATGAVREVVQVIAFVISALVWIAGQMWAYRQTMRARQMLAILAGLHDLT